MFQELVWALTDALFAPMRILVDWEMRELGSA
jgi:hypothetical protein